MTAESATAQLREGDVVRYEPARRHCRDGVAKARRRPDGSIVLHDTYWFSQSDDSVVRPAEFEVLFNINDYERVEKWQWERYGPGHRQVIHAQHGYCSEFYVRKGAVESANQIVENARAALEEARQKLRLATFWVESQERALAEAERAAAKEVSDVG